MIRLKNMSNADKTDFASGGVTFKFEDLCFYSNSVQVDSFALRNPPESNARKHKLPVESFVYGDSANLDYNLEDKAFE